MVLFFLLCVIVLAEVPELITMIDDTTNDFTISNSCSAVHSAPRGEHAVCATTVELVVPECPPHASLLRTMGGFNPISSDLLILYSVLRT
jgi:hypothetical protein